MTAGIDREKKIYLGDSVYVDNDGYGLILTTENGYGASNIIYLEPSVYEALISYVDRQKQIVAVYGTELT